MIVGIARHLKRVLLEVSPALIAFPATGFVLLRCMAESLHEDLLMSSHMSVETVFAVKLPPTVRASWSLSTMQLPYVLLHACARLKQFSAFLAPEIKSIS